MSGADQFARGLPYLHRNWLTAINHLQMGSQESTLSKVNGHGEDGTRPLKRRRVDADGQLPSLFDSLSPEDTEKALRIEVLKIVHKDSARVRGAPSLNGLVPPQAKDVLESKARCRISIYTERGGAWVPLHVDSQLCTMKTYKNPVGPGGMVRVHLPHPFQISQDKLVVPRSDDVLLGLAKAYLVRVELESVGDHNWPPKFLTKVDNDPHMFDTILPEQEWVLSASLKDIYTCHRNRNLEVRVAKHPGGRTLATNYVLDADVKWAVRPSAKAMMKGLEKDVRPTITVVTSKGGVPEADMGGDDGVLGMNGMNAVHRTVNANGVDDPSATGHVVGTANGHSHEDASAEIDEQDDEDRADLELTPNRSRRRGKPVTYNLKVLSDQAAGKERRKRADKFAGRLDGVQGDGGLTYIFPAEQLDSDDFSCCICLAPHDSLSQLRLHLLGHDKYEFDFEPQERGGLHVVVGSRGHAPVRPRILQLGLPLKPFDIEKYVAGDDGWVTSRYGPENDKDLDLGPEKGSRKIRPREKLLPRKNTDKVTVPRTKMPLFHPLSKVELEKGALLEPQVVDESWLIQKHRDALGDFTDLEPHEKEYMKMWDSFILPLHLTSEKYLPRSFLAFVKDKASWLVAVPSRAREFSLHMLVLYTRSVINEDHIQTALQYLNEARDEREKQPAEQTPAEKDPAQPGRRLRNGCTVCGKTVTYGPAFLACTEAECKSRLYHDYCVKDPKVPTDKGDNWRCNDCAT